MFFDHWFVGVGVIWQKLIIVALWGQFLRVVWQHADYVTDLNGMNEYNRSNYHQFHQINPKNHKKALLTFRLYVMRVVIHRTKISNDWARQWESLKEKDLHADKCEQADHLDSWHPRPDRACLLLFILVVVSGGPTHLCFIQVSSHLLQKSQLICVIFNYCFQLRKCVLSVGDCDFD